ncbi:hypothetical protein [Methylobacterium durans]|uniref:hypothetical protein n=1 Tax=Methylobacterium durans TaxID=2202825 RepID=UPI0013A5875D|nr:hypothetical protein [Methylobacterium durans]
MPKSANNTGASASHTKTIPVIAPEVFEGAGLALSEMSREIANVLLSKGYLVGFSSSGKLFQLGDGTLASNSEAGVYSGFQLQSDGSIVEVVRVRLDIVGDHPARSKLIEPEVSV